MANCVLCFPLRTLLVGLCYAALCVVAENKADVAIVEASGEIGGEIGDIAGSDIGRVAGDAAGDLVDPAVGAVGGAIGADVGGEIGEIVGKDVGEEAAIVGEDEVQSIAENDFESGASASAPASAVGPLLRWSQCGWALASIALWCLMSI